MEYTVNIEINGRFTEVGKLSDSGFIYSPVYLDQKNPAPISISLPLQSERFSRERTAAFFEGLLPEGFSRRMVAEWMRVPEDDYLSILAGLGRECLGAIQICNSEGCSNGSYDLLSPDEVKALAAEGATASAKIVTESHLSLTGASGKVGLYYDRDSGNWYRPTGIAPSTHIVKQSHVRLSSIVVNELLCLHTAQKCGIDVPDCFIVEVDGKNDDGVLFATQRYDREFRSGSKIISGLSCPYRLHQEDFAQALGIPASMKYELAGDTYLKKMFGLLRGYSKSPIDDCLKLWDRIVFNCLIGNTDSHLKNFSIIYDADMSGKRLAPAYDVVSTAVYESCTRRLSMRIGNAEKLDDLSEEAFRKAANEVGISEKLAIAHLDSLKNKYEKALSETASELSDSGFNEALKLKERILKSGIL